MPKKNQKGFAHLGIILLVVVIAVVGFTGYQVYKKQHNGRSNNYQTSYSGSNSSSRGGPLSALPACSSSTYLNHLPTDETAFTGVEALGHINGQHVLPSQGDHMGVIMVPAGNNTSKTTNVYSPGNVTIVQITAMTQTAGSSVTGSSQAGHTDYLIDFAPCRDVVMAFGHVETLSSAIRDALSSTKPQCSNGSIVDNCMYNNLKITLTSGELIGTAGGPTFAGNGFDFGAVDDRTKTLGFINTSGSAAQTGFININGIGSYTHAACPLDYFSPNLKQVLYSRITMKNQGANGIPACGTTMQDKAGTAQGDWYDQNSKNSNQGLDIAGALAFAHSNLDASMAEVSVGTDLAQSQYGGTQLIYTPTHRGYINREPSEIKPDGHVYCFEGHEGAILNNTQGDYIHFDAQLTNSTTLKIDYGTGSCSTNPSLSSSITYTR